MAQRPVQIAMSLSYLTGLRMGDVLRLTFGDAGKEYLAAREHKVDQVVRFAMTSELREVISRAQHNLIPANHRLKRMERLVRAATGNKHAIVRATRTRKPDPAKGETVGGLGGYIFNKDGRPFGFHANWQRTITSALTDTELEERFHFHDIRAKHVTDRDETEIQSSIALGHGDISTTRKYLRHPLGRVVQPLGKNLS